MSTTNDLYGVSCVSASDCWAAGIAGTNISFQPLAEHWDGSSWTIISSPTESPVESSNFYGLTCVSSVDCWAVGFSYPFPRTSGVYQPIIEHWDGATWVPVSTPSLGTTPHGWLQSVACASESDCWAAGKYYDANNIGLPLLEHWDGSSWSIVGGPSPHASRAGDFLYGVTCTSGADCWSVGFSFIRDLYQPLVEHWNGASWGIVQSANPDVIQASTFVLGLACGSESDCWAVGYNSAEERPVLEHWNGGSWVIAPIAAPAGGIFLGVTCFSTSNCWAVGDYYDGSTGIYQTLAEHWDGASWTVVSSPNPGETNANALFAVSCASATDCWAVGASALTLGSQPLLEHWNGTSWNIAMTSAGTGNLLLPTYLSSVTCTSVADCWAVGGSTDQTSDQTLIEHWDGNSWSTVAAPNSSSTQNNYLYSVSCDSTSDCWAAGDYFDGTVFRTLIQRWDGSSWTVVTTPNTIATEDNYLSGVTCNSGSDCWVAGSAHDGSTGTHQTLLQHWDGSSWTLVQSPNPGAQTNILNAITCNSSADCWAGGYFLGTTIYQTLIEHYAVPVQLSAVVSRKIHGSAGTFDIDLTSGNGIECRSGGISGDYTVVFTFANPLVNVVSANLTTGTGALVNGAIDSNDAHNYVVKLTGVANAQRLTLTLSDVRDNAGNFSSAVSGTMGVLLGDVNASARVDAADVSAVRQQTLQSINDLNFRNDINASGRIDAADVSIVRQQTLTSLP
jgi:hypothetical protein